VLALGAAEAVWIRVDDGNRKTQARQGPARPGCALRQK